MPDWLHPQFPRLWHDEKRASLGRGVEKRLRVCANEFASRKPDPQTWPTAAVEAYARLVGVRAMEKVCDRPYLPCTQPARLPRPPPSWQVRNRAGFSKMRALLAELAAAHAQDPLARVVVFTQFDEVQQAIVAMLWREANAYTVYSFNKYTPASQRHRLIREFQNVPTGGKAAVCVATYLLP